LDFSELPASWNPIQGKNAEFHALAIFDIIGCLKCFNLVQFTVPALFETESAPVQGPTLKSSRSKMAQQLSDNDHEMLELLRANPSLSIGQLIEQMGVTATAVRQRLTRLMALGLVMRSPAIEGRGRPSHLYELTEKGQKAQPNNLGDLAVVLWQEVQLIADDQTRQRIILGAVQRLAEKYESEVHGSTAVERMKAIAQLFAERQIPLTFEDKDELPVIKVAGCPYPTLVQENREICDLEKRLLEKIIGQPVELCECTHDGDSCCSFKTVPVKLE
jgi:predicted ArsR family transcriptional regulator